MSRELLEQELFMQKIKVLQPESIFSCRPYEKNEHLALNPVIIGEYLLDWDSSNVESPPSISMINSVDITRVNEMLDLKMRDKRNREYSSNLALKGLFMRALAENPSLTFADYVDQLESFTI